MDAERARTFLHHLPHVVETMQWGANLVFWVGDKAIGGKMFTLVDLDCRGGNVISFSAGPELYNDLLELEGLVPAPYLARVHWVAAGNWSALRNAEWEQHLRNAHHLTFARLPPRVRATLNLPAPEQRRIIAERRDLLARREAARVASKAAGRLT